jgi:hypothetical protein
MTAIHVSGTHSFYYGGRDNPKKIRWWAEHGIIHYRDETTGIQSSMSRRTFLERLAAVSAQLRGGRDSNDGFMSRDEQERTLRFIENGVALAKTAQLQGDPDDPKVFEQKINERPTALFIPGSME